jgi:hypothetical protein
MQPAMDSLQVSISEMTQIERDKLIEWFRINRPNVLREGLLELKYLVRPIRPAVVEKDPEPSTEVVPTHTSPNWCGKFFTIPPGKVHARSDCGY